MSTHKNDFVGRHFVLFFNLKKTHYEGLFYRTMKTVLIKYMLSTYKLYCVHCVVFTYFLFIFTNCSFIRYIFLYFEKFKEQSIYDFQIFLIIKFLQILNQKYQWWELIVAKMIPKKDYNELSHYDTKVCKYYAVQSFQL